MSNLNDFGKAEILGIIDSVSRERGLPKARLIEAVEQAIQMSARKKYGSDHQIVAQIDQNSGKISIYRERIVVEEIENASVDILLEDAMLIDSEAKLGDTILEPLPPIDLGRVAAQVAKQVIVQKVGDAERESQYEAYKDRKGDILNGTVKRIEMGNVIVDVGRAEAILYRNQQIRGERYQVGDRVKAYVQDVRQETRGPQIILSRTDNNFLAKLFAAEVPEIYDNIIEIKSVAREPGSKAKIAVYTADISIDAIGSCVGIKGNRVRNITEQLGGEKIDIVKWDDNIVQYAINAMTPATITKIVFNEENRKLEIIVNESQLSLAIGRGGQNVRLASKLIGWTIDVMTESEESKRRNDEFANTTNLFVEKLDIDEVMAQLLSVEGYNKIEQIAYVDIESLKAIEGISEELAQELQRRAVEYVEQQNEQIIEQLEQLGVEQELLDYLDLAPEYILKLAEFGVKSLEDLAETTVEEFHSVVPKELISKENVESLIAGAKVHNENDDN